MNEHLNNSVTLPDWLDHIIFNELGAVYNPDYFKFSYNLDHTKDDILVYLGTYFPRSYAEAYIIMCDLLANETVRSAFAAKDRISILDLGCGTGGEIFGALCTLACALGKDKVFKVVAVDGNPNATRMFERVLCRVKKETGFAVDANVGSVAIDDKADMVMLGDVVNEGFDIVLSFKAVNEFIQRKRFAGNAYRHFAEMLAPKLSDEGLLILLDVATRDELSGVFYPVIMNAGLNGFVRECAEFATLLPLPCMQGYADCITPCYMQQRFRVSHSHKVNDLSKVAYRVIGRKNFVASLNLVANVNSYSYKINDNGGACCPRFTGVETKNGFKLIL